MGLNKHDKGAVYLYPVGGKLAIKHKTATSTTVTRTNKKGETVHEELFDSIDGVITGLATEKSDYGNQLVISLYDPDDDQEYKIRVPLSSQYTYGIFKRIGNIDFSRPLKLRPYFIEEPNGSKAGFTVYQDDKKIELAYSKDNPNGMPELVEKTIKGQSVWDDTDRLKFFAQLVKTQVAPVIEANSKLAMLGATSIDALSSVKLPDPDPNISLPDLPEETEQEELDVDDLPF